jgi:hypothetical protein
MHHLGSTSVFYLLLAVLAGCGSEGGTRPTRQYPDGSGGLASELPTGAAGAPGAPNEGVDTGLGLDPSGAAGSGSPALPSGDPSSPAQSLREAAALSGRLIGTALAANRLNDVAYAAAAREFNYVHRSSVHPGRRCRSGCPVVLQRFQYRGHFGGRSEPLLFDANYQRKGAYFGVFDALVAAGAG